MYRRINIFAFLLAFCTAFAASANPKQRVEQEFRQVEAALGRCMYDEVLLANDFESMNKILSGFMLDNPGVVRIIRANAGGYTVNDMGSESARSAPPRDLSGQRWFKHASQNKRPYYSMDLDTMSGDISLFYAWPLMTGQDGSRFSGAFAAVIDFAAQLALIDNAAPFLVAHEGRALFEHEWHDGDYSEAPLDIKGAQGLTIRTAKPLSTRLDPRAPSARPAAAQKASSKFDAESAPEYNGDDEEPAAAAKSRKKKKQESGGGFINTGIFLLLLAIAAMLAYQTMKEHIGRIRIRIFRDPPPQKSDQGKSPAEMPQPGGGNAKIAGTADDIGDIIEEIDEADETRKDTEKIEAINTSVVDRNVVVKSVRKDNVVDSSTVVNNIIDNNAGKKTRSENELDQQLISKMLKLIKEEFILMEKKILMLSQRIDKLERDRK